MTRRLFNIAAALSLLICGATCVLWVRSHRAAGSVDFHRRGGLWALVSGGGRLTLTNAPQIRFEREESRRERNRLSLECVSLWQRQTVLKGVRRDGPGSAEDGTARASLDAEAARLDALALVNRQQRAGWSRRPLSTTTAVERSVHYALPTVAAAAVPALWLLLASRTLMRQRVRRRNHLCLRCGYDLRATPGTCPECGEARPAARSAEPSVRPTPARP